MPPLAPSPVAALRALAPFSDAAAAAFTARCHPRRYAAGEWLLREGDRATLVHFVTAGLVRELYVTADGAEHTRAFVAEGQATGSLLDLLGGGPSVTWIEALEPTETVACAWADLDRLCVDHPELHHPLRRVAEALYVRKARREYEMLALPAAERHARWLAEHPALDARLQRRHVASYLGITPEHLSRLRRRPSP